MSLLPSVCYLKNSVTFLIPCWLTHRNCCETERRRNRIACAYISFLIFIAKKSSTGYYLQATNEDSAPLQKKPAILFRHGDHDAYILKIVQQRQWQAHEVRITVHAKPHFLEGRILRA